MYFTTPACRGTLGIDEIEVSSNCHLMFGRRAHIAGQGFISAEGVLRVPTLTVADGGEVTVPAGVSDRDSTLSLDVSGEQFCWLVFFFFFFFFAFPSYISGVHHFWVRFLRM